MGTLKVVSEAGKANLITHGGKMHADEVMATAILLLIFSQYKQEKIKEEDLPDNLKVIFAKDKLRIARVDRIEAGILGSADKIVYDIGGGELDHHSFRRKRVESGISYGSAGLIWNEYGSLLCSTEEVWAGVDRNLICAIDSPDNGDFAEISNDVPIYNIGDMVVDFNTNLGDEDTMEERFVMACKIMMNILRCNILKEEAKKAAYKMVEDALSEMGEDGVLILEENIRWQGVLKNMLNENCINYDNASRVKLVVYPSIRQTGHYYVESPLREKRVLMPEEWRGLDESSLFDLVDGADFCHQDGFLAGAVDKLHAIAMARMAIYSAEQLD